MALTIQKAEVWVGEIDDRAGALASVLRSLGDAGASLECVIGRRQPDKPGKGIVFLTPVKGKKVQDAARAAGLAPAPDIGTLRVEGPDKPGLGAEMSSAIAEAGISLRGVSAMVLGSKFVAYFGFDSVEDANRAATALKSR